MTERSQSDNDCISPAQAGCGSAEQVRHPAWCDPALCTADPARQADGYRAELGGEHRSAPIPLDLATAFPLPAREGTAWLTEACAPWRCAVYLRIQVCDLELSMTAECAGHVLAGLSTLLASAELAEEVTP